MEESNYWQRLARRRVSRRALLGASATTALGGAAAMIVGCGGGGNNGGTSGPTGTRRPTSSAPVSSGTITAGRPVTVLGIDPHVDLTGLDIDTLLYPYLYGWAPGREQRIMNNLAADLEMPDPDNLEFIFTLRQGVKNSPWTDRIPGAGEEITSADCKASFIRRGTSISAPDKRFPRKIGKDAAAMDAAIQTPDPYTFSFKMTAPFVPAIREMANPTWAIASEKVLDATLGTGLSQVAYGAGPFSLKEFRGNERVVLEKNPNYFLKPLPYLDGQTTVIITENSSLLTAFKQGQHDVCGAILTREDYDDFSNNPDYSLATAPNLFYPVVHLKVIRQPFDQISVREAIDISIDRDEIINIIQNSQGGYNGPIQWAQTKWALPQDELKQFYKYDPDRAKTLLSDAGYPNGFNATMKLPKITGVSFIADIASLLKDQWSRVGINIQLEEVELGAYISSVLLPGNFDMTFFPNLPYDEPDRPLSFYSSLGVTGAGNWTNYSNPTLDALIEKQSQQFDENERKATILEAQRMILKEHGPQLTLTGDYAYSARWWYVHFPFELGQDPSADVHPNGVDIWREPAA
jgi:ABC-type transport system substrate-binding protein